MLEPFIKLFKLINSEQEPHQVSLGLSLGMITGLTPTFSMHNLLVLFVLLMIRANVSAYIASYILFSLLAFGLDPLFHSFGNYLLHLPSMQATWTEMYNNSFWRLTNYNNTVTLGSLAVSLIALVPVFLAGNILIRNYRTRIQARFANATRRLNKLLGLGGLFGRFSEGG